MIQKESLTHLRQGQPGMVEVGHKADTKRFALAQSVVHIPASLGALLADEAWESPKGPVFHTAIIAGTLAAKNTAGLIPFCHPLSISGIKIHISLASTSLITITCAVKTLGKTGVEMEALTGASVAALTIYDMCKSVSTDLVIGDIRLLEKTGGKRDLKRTGIGGRAKLKDEAGQGSFVPERQAAVAGGARSLKALV